MNHPKELLRSLWVATVDMPQPCATDLSSRTDDVVLKAKRCVRARPSLRFPESRVPLLEFLKGIYKGFYRVSTRVLKG